MFRILKAVLLIAVVLWLFRQVRKPSGPLGRRILQGMNRSHAAMTEWGLQQVVVPKDAAILDVGCGGGRTVQRLAALAPEGRIIGLDSSVTSVAVSRDTNAREIATGRVQIQQGSVVALPFSDGTFDLVTAVETHYYWPDLPANVREILRVAQTRRKVRFNRRNVPGWAFPPVVCHSHAPAPPSALKRRGAQGPPDAGWI